MTAKIQLVDIVQEYPNPLGGPDLRIVDGLNITYEGSGINMLLGPSGCGKSTVLKMMGGVRPLNTKTPTSGTVKIDDVPCTNEHDDVVMVFQKYLNRLDLTVRENVEFPFRFKLWKRKVSRQERKERVDKALESVGLGDKADHYPNQLSGGQNQRVALARALVLRPRILLMDEPFGALDAQIRSEMQSLLVKLWEDQKCLVMFVTHDITEALLLGDRVTVFSTQPAQIAADFRIEQPRPRSEAWLRSEEATELADRIIRNLRHDKVGAGGGQLRVTV